VFCGGVGREPVDGADHGQDGVGDTAFAALGEVSADGLPDEIGGRPALGGGDFPQLPVDVLLEVDLCPPHHLSIHHFVSDVYVRMLGCIVPAVDQPTGGDDVASDRLRPGRLGWAVSNRMT